MASPSPIPAAHRAPPPHPSPPRFTPGNRRRSTATLVLAVAALGSIPSSAAAEEPTADDFRISYFRRLDEYDRIDKEWDDERRSFMTANDMQRHINRARCVCGDQVRIDIQRNGSERMIDSGRLEVWVGEACSETRPQNVGQIYGDCSSRDAYQTDAAAEWLQSVPNQLFDVSTFANPTPPGVEEAWVRDGVDPACNGNQGTGGVWVCFGSQSCINREYFIQGNHSANSTQQSNDNNNNDGGGAAQSSGGLNYDFRGPVAPPVDIKANPGDSSITLTWNLQTSADIAGYRVLCADSAGKSLGLADEFIDTDAPPASYANDASIYHTAQMFCGRTFEEIPEDPPDPTESSSTTAQETGAAATTSESTGATSDSTGTGSEGTTTGTTGEWFDRAGARAGVDETDGEQVDDDSAGNGGSTPSSDEGTPAEDETERDKNPWAYESKSGIESLNWRYLCSEHIERKQTSVRVEGLENDRNYRFVLVAYDRAGNPTASEVVEGRPERTLGVEGLCEDPDLLCGEAGFCTIGPNHPRDAIGWGLILLTGFAGGTLRRNRRRNR